MRIADPHILISKTVAPLPSISKSFVDSNTESLKVLQSAVKIAKKAFEIANRELEEAEILMNKVIIFSRVFHSVYASPE